MVEIKDVLELIEQLEQDSSIPKNVRQSLLKIKEILETNEDIAIKVDSAMQILEELSLDPNLSSHARTQIWNLTSTLEALAE